MANLHFVSVKTFVIHAGKNNKEKERGHKENGQRKGEKKNRKLQGGRKETKRRENLPCQGIFISPVCHGQRANFSPSLCFIWKFLADTTELLVIMDDEEFASPVCDEISLQNNITETGDNFIKLEFMF